MSQVLAKTPRVEDPDTIKAMRKDYCELCGKPAYKEPHHIKSRGAGGGDIPENLIQLCSEHHFAAHMGNIPREDLVKIVAARENKTPEEICQIIGLNLAVDNIKPGNVINSPATLEELLQVYVSLDETMDETKFFKGEIIEELLRRGLAVGQIAQYGRCSNAQVRELVKTYRAFPEESMRVPELTWYHHRLAANTNNPEYWIQEAARFQWSTRQMREAIKIAEGETPLTQEEKMLNKAEKALRMLEEVRGFGGEPWAWLYAKLQEWLQETAKETAADAA